MKQVFITFEKGVSCILFFLFIGVIGLMAQETVPASGGNATGNGGSVSYTVGQIVYTTNTGVTGYVAQGVQQPYEISVVFVAPGSEEITLEATVYPNPVADVFTLHIINFEKFDGKTIAYYFYTTDNILLLTKNVESAETVISISYLPPEIYYLILVDITNSTAPKRLKTFKIMKN